MNPIKILKTRSGTQSLELVLIGMPLPNIQIASNAAAAGYNCSIFRNGVGLSAVLTMKKIIVSVKADTMAAAMPILVVDVSSSLVSLPSPSFVYFDINSTPINARINNGSKYILNDSPRKSTLAIILKKGYV